MILANYAHVSAWKSSENQFKQFEYFVRFPESDGPWFEDPKADAVQHVENEKQVKKLIKKKEPMLLMFYTPWCSACKTVKKEFHFISWDAHANFCTTESVVEIYYL